MVLAKAIDYKLECRHLGYSTTFLNADVTEEVG